MTTKARAPQLYVIIDTEEEFDWDAPFDRRARAVTSIPAQQRAQDIFARYDLVPSYVIDHPVADNPEAVAVLKAWQDEGQAVIGAHLHPWVSPPFDEEVSRQNSYPGNLPKSLEYEKLRQLTALIERVFRNARAFIKRAAMELAPIPQRSSRIWAIRSMPASCPIPISALIMALIFAMKRRIYGLFCPPAIFWNCRFPRALPGFCGSAARACFQ
ncbi:hypothetical protein [Iodidimonas nitroreducens]|uniref:hypothetical protein n=1 Tax=Iodidimonas nitroreducens TaxID=1236968 RepID=UPI001231387F|nr:hypothetical protein [Iodidimonas nitroreducens]